MVSITNTPTGKANTMIATTMREYRCANANCAEHLCAQDVPAYEQHGRVWPDEGRLACGSCGEHMEENPDVTTDEIGRGQLTWPRIERVTDRYGCVMLTTPHSGFDESLLSEGLPLQVRPGAQGTLKAEILETRRSHHIGDLFRGYGPPEQPLPVGTIVTLGYGRQFAENVEGIDTVGVWPLHEPTTDWLSPSVLYEVHDQTVRLFFEREL